MASVQLGIDPDGRGWIRNLQARRSDEELKEEGEGARELNASEANFSYRKDPLAEYPTNLEREKKLRGDDDLMPPWDPSSISVRVLGRQSGAND